MDRFDFESAKHEKTTYSMKKGYRTGDTPFEFSLIQEANTPPSLYVLRK